MELETAARRFMLADATLRGYVQDRVFKFRLELKIDGSGRSALVVNRSNAWTAPDPVKWMEFPVLRVHAYADPRRDTDGQIAELDAEDRAFALYRVLDRMLHARRDYTMGAQGSQAGLKVVSSARWAEPFMVTDKDRHGDGDPLGDALYVVGQWALVVVH
jgi:hypothetical protein